MGADAVADLVGAGLGADTTAAEPVAPQAAEPAIPEVTPEQPAEGVSGGELEGAEPAQPTEPAEPAEQPARQAEPLPAEVAKLLREVRQANPQNANIARQLQDSYYRDRQFAEIFPTVEDARASKATLDALGGSEGLVELQARASRLEEVDNLVDAGDPRVVEAMASESPEGFKRLMPHALQRLEQLDPQSYNSLLRNPLVRALDAYGLPQAIVNILQLFRDGQQDYGVRELTRIGEWLQQLKQETARTPQPDDGREQQFRERERQINERESATFRSDTNRELADHLRSGIMRSLSPLLKGRGFTPDNVKDLVVSIAREVIGTVQSDKGAAASAEALMAKRNRDGYLNFSKAQMDRVLHKTVTSVWTRRYGAAAKPAAQPAQPGAQPARPAAGAKQPPSATTTIVLPKKPALNDIDMGRTTQEMMLTHQAYLKSGKRVSWGWS